MPRRALNAQGTHFSTNATPSKYLQAEIPASSPRLAVGDDTSDSLKGSHIPVQTAVRSLDSGNTGATAHADPSVTSKLLSQRFQQLQVSPEERLGASTQLTPIKPSSVGASDHVYSHSDAAAPRFRFPSLPAKLTDEGFHYRQRAAQFILLYSQQANPENLSRYNRLSSPLSYGSYDSSNFGVSGSYPRRGAGTHEGDVQALEEPSCCANLDDDDSVHSHHHAHNASDDESEYLDFEACRTAHLGNKKKRKSSRFTSPGVPVIGSISSFDETLQTKTADLPPHSASSHRANSSVSNTQVEDRALIDRTNTLGESAPRLSIECDLKPNDNLAASTELAQMRRQRYLRLPPRQTSGEHQRAILRSRIRARLAPVFRQRQLDRIEQEAREKKAQQARREAQDAQAKADAEANAPTTPEKPVPPKRTNKAGKRAQAIRGGNSPAKPLTIAELRARASAGAASGGLQISSGASPAKARASASPTRVGPKTDMSQATSAKSDSRTPPSHSSEAEQSARKLESGSGDQAKETAPITKLSASKTPASLNLSPQAASFDFRMSSSVTLRLRELRSQLDTATRDLSDKATQGDAHAVAKAFNETVSASLTTDAPASEPYQISSTTRMVRYGDDLGDNAPPWVRHALEYQHQLEQQQKAGNRSRPSRSPVKAVPAPQPPPTAAPRSRSESSTPARQAAHPTSSSSTPSKSTPAPSARNKTKSTNGRRTSARKPVEPAHHHGASCRYGHAHGHGRPHGTGSALFTDDDWICVFCEYELYYGEAPRMLRAVRNRKKLVEKKTKAKTKAQAALQKKSSAPANGASCQHHHHDHEHDHHDHDDHHGCEHGHDHTCHHDHSRAYGSDDHHHDHHRPQQQQRHDRRNGRLPHQHPHSHGHLHGAHDDDDDDAHRDRCDCGNSIHSSDFDEEDK